MTAAATTSDVSASTTTPASVCNRPPTSAAPAQTGASRTDHPQADRPPARLCAPRIPPRANRSVIMQSARDLFSYRQYWAARLTPAPVLSMSRAEMEACGWDECDDILVTGDAYVDHPSFVMAVVGRLLESQGFRVGIISQPDWKSPSAFAALGKPRLFFGVTAG